MLWTDLSTAMRISMNLYTYDVLDRNTLPESRSMIQHKYKCDRCGKKMMIALVTPAHADYHLCSDPACLDQHHLIPGHKPNCLVCAWRDIFQYDAANPPPFRVISERDLMGGIPKCNTLVSSSQAKLQAVLDRAKSEVKQNTM